MKLPIRNYTENPLTLFIEPLCEEYFVPPNAEAIVRLEDNYPHSIDVYKSQVTIWNEACNEAVVELVSVEQKKIVEAIQLIQV